MNYTTLDYSLYYAKRGWYIFPVKPGDKTPLVKWADECTTDQEKIKSWWSQWPNANIGIVTGAKSGLLVLDIDSGHGGDESLFSMLVDHGKLPDTIMSLTGGGGRHYLFQHPGGEIRNSAGKYPGIDIRCDGGYIVAPPSLHPSGKNYIWEESSKPSSVELAPAPEWLIAMYRNGNNNGNGNGHKTLEQEGVYISGQRNNAMTSLAGTMRRRGMSEDAIYQALLAENQAKCVPPLNENEIKLISQSVFRYEPKAEPVHSTQGERQRLELELLLAASIYNNPERAKDIEWLKPFMLLDTGVRIFWERCLSGTNATTAASESGILDQITRLKPEPDRITEFASQIARFGYLATVGAAYADIRKFTEIGDVQKVQQIIRELADETPAIGIKPITSTDGLLSFLALVADPDRTPAIKTRLGNFDAEVGGLERGILSILAARPSVGKTSLAWQIARNVAADHNRVIFFSLEMTARNLWSKAVCGIAETRHRDILNNTITDATRTRMLDEIIPTLIEVYGDNLLIVDEASTSESIWQTTMQHGADLVIVDYLGLVGDEAENEIIRLHRITATLKALSKRANCHVMVLAQLSRGIEGRDNKRPQLPDLRDSGHIEQNADMVLMMYRAGYYEENKRERYSETELILRKNRNDEAGYSLTMYYDMLQQWFYRRNEIAVTNINLERMTQ